MFFEKSFLIKEHEEAPTKNSSFFIEYQYDHRWNAPLPALAVTLPLWSFPLWAFTDI